ncbi:MAG: hypothetical protein NUV65_00590 [Candidatus Roizmanbacteria bacterium]|nr:hypothetical protein [Candidatus Roizmanbacteria bacterium]
MIDRLKLLHTLPATLSVNPEVMHSRTQHMWESEASRLANIFALRVAALNAGGMLQPWQEMHAATINGFPATYIMSRYPQVHVGANEIAFIMPQRIIDAMGAIHKHAELLYAPEDVINVALRGIWAIRAMHVDTEVDTRFIPYPERQSELQFFVTVPQPIHKS